MIETHWNSIVIVLCVLLAAFMLWQEVSRAKKKWLWSRMIAAMLASAMLACIAMHVSYQKDAGANQGTEFVLLTKGFKADRLKNNAAQKMFAVDATVKKAYPKATLLNGLEELTDTLKGNPVHVYGNGLSKFQLAQLKSIPLVFHRAELPAGVSHINWNKTLKAGEKLRIQGSYNNPSAKTIKLLLTGLNTVVDTITIKPNAQADFELTTAPKTLGRVVYTLQSVADGDTTTEGSIPVRIDAVKPVKVLMLSAAPDFETRFLKNWLSQNGYAVAARSGISKDKFSSEFINIPQFGLDRLSASTLHKFDVVTGELSNLSNLNAAESTALKQEVENNGLGIIIRADSAGKTSWLQRDFPIERQAGKESPSSIVINGKKTTSAQLNIGNSFLRYQNGTQPVGVGSQNRIVINSTIAGSGKLIFSTLANTYSWVLSGNRQDYSALWSVLISKAARKDTSFHNTVSIPDLPILGEPASLLLAGGKTSALLINGELVAAEQNPAIPFEQSADYWPMQPGWQTIGQNGKTEWWYAYNKNEWQSVKATEKIAATTKYVKEHRPGSNVTKQIQQKLRIEVPKIYFYILLLAALTFLWVEKKLL